MSIFGKRVPSPPAGSPEARLIHASLDADAAVAALCAALDARRAALGDLNQVTAASHRGIVNGALSSSVPLRCMTAIAKHLGTPHVATRHRLSFEANARATIVNTAAGRSPALTEEAHP